jgi:hypothetical protein
LSKAWIEQGSLRAALAAFGVCGKIWHVAKNNYGEGKLPKSAFYK